MNIFAMCAGVIRIPPTKLTKRHRTFNHENLFIVAISFGLVISGADSGSKPLAKVWCDEV